MREWLARLRDWFRRDALDGELAEEMRFHQAQLERDARVDGAVGGEAAYVARRRIGNVTLAREEARDRWSVPWLDHLQQDVRYAWRGLRRSPGFTTTVVATLALGLGANVTMFGIVDRLMFRPLPYLRDPAQVHRVYLQTTIEGRTRTNSTIPYTRYLDLQKGTTAFSDYATVTERPMAIGVGDAAREQLVAGVSGTFFSFFDARPAIGRFFNSDEDRVPVGSFVVVLGHSFWQSELGGRDVVGKVLQVGTLPYTIIGVVPPGFVGAAIDRTPAAFIPITTVPANDELWTKDTYFTSYSWDWTSVIVRQKPAVSDVAASADLTAAFIRSRAAQKLINPAVLPPEKAHPRAIAGAVKPAAGPDASLESKTLLWVTGVAVIVLLIACANVTNLMFARVLRRRREIAVRLALGVSRPRLALQFIIEGVMLALLGCVAAIAIAQWGGAALRAILGGEGAGVSVVTDWRTLAVACAFALVTGLLTAVGPSLLAIRGDLAGTLRAGAREGTYQRSTLRSSLLIAQGALSVVLLVGAGLFVRSLDRVKTMRLGYDAEAVLIATPNYRGLQMDTIVRVASRRQLLETAEAIPGVVAAAIVGSRPFGTNTTDLFVPGIDSVPKLGRFNFQRATPGYFKTMGTRIIRGRSFTAQDRENTPGVVVVSDAMARVLWPGQDPIGQCVHIGVHSDTKPCSTVIGVAENAMQQNLTDDQQFMYYVPVEQLYPSGGGDVYVRIAGGDPAASAESVRRALQRVMPGQGYVTVQSLESVIDNQRRSWMVGAAMFVAFGVLALMVAAVGLYGVITYDVAQRLHELGVRIALGAQASDIIRLVVGQGVSFAVVGAAIGLGIALAAARWIQPLLFKQPARDPITYASVAVLIVLVAILASALPAFRATRADPNTALRSD